MLLGCIPVRMTLTVTLPAHWPVLSSLHQLCNNVLTLAWDVFFMPDQLFPPSLLIPKQHETWSTLADMKLKLWRTTMVFWTGVIFKVTIQPSNKVQLKLSWVIGEQSVSVTPVHTALLTHILHYMQPFIHSKLVVKQLMLLLPVWQLMDTWLLKSNSCFLL